MVNFTPIGKNSAANLNSFIDTFDNSWKAIEALKVDNLSDYLICHLALRGLDTTTRKLFEDSRDQKLLPSFAELMSFVNNQIKVLEHTFPNSYSSPVILERKPITKNQTIYNNYKPRSLSEKQALTTSSALSNNNFKSNNINSKFICLHCNQNHMIYRCEQFRKLSPDARIDRVKALKLCTNCLKANHDNLSCKSVMYCGVCDSPHHYLLHKDAAHVSAVSTVSTPCNINFTSNRSQLQQVLVTGRSVSESEAGAQKLQSTDNKHNYSVVLGTARLHVRDMYGGSQDCRAVLDSGAQCSFITTDCAQRLGLPRKQCPYSIYGLGGEAVKNHGMVTCTFSSRRVHEPYFTVDMVVVSKVSTDMPNISFPSTVIDEYKNFTLADPFYYKRSRVDILLGNDIVSELIKDKPIIIKSNIPQVIETVFGFVVSGKLWVSDTDNMLNSYLSSSINEEPSLDITLRKFWEIEELPCQSVMNPLDELAEKIFIKYHTRDSKGRYMVPLLFRPNHPSLGDSLIIAERRLRYTERKLTRTPMLQKAYTEFMKEYESLDHMEPYNNCVPSKYVIPHHSIVRPSSSSTPLRVVFDASAKSDNNVSLNDILLTRPKLYRDIVAIILNFRLFQYCLVSDICKMYRAISLRKEDRCCYQHILYRDAPSKPIQLYELKTVTYGLSCSPFLAIRTLLQLADDEGEQFPMAAQVLRENIYMDDILCSCENLQLACKLQDELIELLSRGGFVLKKWASNKVELLERVPVEHRECPIDFIKDENECTVKVLGLRWVPLSDRFNFTVNVKDYVNTKRSVLKILASIYDPVGFISPCLFMAKEIMQDLWKLGIGWDEQMPAHICKRWTDFITELPCLSEILIERHMLLPNQLECELVGFCDASSRVMPRVFMLLVEMMKGVLK
ncbi:uncharacterized protein LOC131854365 [Achroia grisella]|uniref:uncharacterized protein LOC131854365 n=1 Tax=Achroia grisella TaxID=688607 RepID=UPI0027D2AB89|nr:uncharacterized protein LOC131854365 [Achroia grisella]